MNIQILHRDTQYSICNGKDSEISYLVVITSLKRL